MFKYCRHSVKRSFRARILKLCASQLMTAADSGWSALRFVYEKHSCYSPVAHKHARQSDRGSNQPIEQSAVQAPG